MKLFGLEFKFNGFDIWHKGNFDPDDKIDKSKDITISKISPKIILDETDGDSGTYPLIDFTTSNKQGIQIRHCEFDGELPELGYGLIIERDDANVQPNLKPLLSVQGNIYSDNKKVTTIGHTHDLKDLGDSGSTPYFISGQGTVAGTWLGTEPKISSYYDGLSILYRVPIAGAGTTTININGLGAKTIYRYGSSKLTTHYQPDSILLLIYSSSQNGGCFMTEGSDYDSNESYTVRWNTALQAGYTISDYKLVMFGLDGKLYPLTLEGGLATNKTVSTVEFASDSPIIYYGSTTDIPADGVSSSYWYNGVLSGGLGYTANQLSGFIAYRPLYLKVKITENGGFKLDNSTFTSWLTQTLPTSEDGFVYILVGYMNNTTTSFKLIVSNTKLEFKDGAIRLFVPKHKHSKSEITDMPTSLPANGGNSDTVDLKHASDFVNISKEYLGSVSSSGWYTIATASTARGIGEFIIYDTDSGKHNMVRLLASTSYGQNSVTVTGGIRYGTETLQKVRILYSHSNRVYGGAKLQIYCVNPAITLRHRMRLDQINGWDYWVPQNPVLENSPTDWDEDPTTIFSNITDGGVHSILFEGSSITQPTSDNSTKIATTAYVKAQGYITSGQSGARITTTPTAPSSPSAGDFWYKEI